jgi:hypothetical protein
VLSLSLFEPFIQQWTHLLHSVFPQGAAINDDRLTSPIDEPSHPRAQLTQRLWLQSLLRDADNHASFLLGCGNPRGCFV